MADQKQWPEKIKVARDGDGAMEIVPVGEDWGSQPIWEIETYVPKAALEKAEEERDRARRNNGINNARAEKAEAERDSLRDSAKTVCEAHLRTMGAYEKSQASLASERERVTKARRELQQRARDAEAEERRRVSHGMNGAGPHSAMRAYEAAADLLAALSPSPVEGEKCPTCGGSGKKTHVGTAGHAVTIACSDCHGTGKKQPDPMEDLSAAHERSDNQAIPSQKPDPEEGRELTVPGCINCGLPTTSCTCKGNLGWRGEVRTVVLEVIDKTPRPDSSKEADRGE